MRKVTALLVSSLMTLVFAQAQAGEHGLTSIKGTNIDLKMVNHGIAGSIRDFIIMGKMNEEDFSSELKIWRDGKMIDARFYRNEQRIGGIIHHTTKDESFTTIIELDRVEPESNLIVVRVNNKEIPVQIEAASFENNHFKNPTYTADLGNEKVSFSIENGEACYGYSVHLIFMILGSYLH